MPLRVSGKNIKIGEALRGRINARLAEAMAKYFDGGFSGHVTIGRDGFGFRTECVVHLDSGIVLEAEALAADAYASADQAAIRIETRLRRYKRRRKDRQGTRDDGRVRDRGAHERDQVDAPGPTVAVPASDEQESAESNPAIIAESIAALKRLSVSEAVMELDVTGASVLVFRHAGHGRVNLVYRRPDGHIGWIDPPTVEQDAH
ncbi:MAG TPA: ribosome-associated translation inhibitor RaiA [Xanthobacteraceae bacterium]|nr:ribosome-associated translation inhibitor RaiA [Xanthobacteraceae bacterium]